MRSWAAAVVLGACAVGCSAERTMDAAGSVDARPGRFVDLEFDAGGGKRIAVLYVPAAYDGSDHAWPLVVFLHGLGERGDDGKQRTVGIGPAIEKNPERFPCLVLMPQCPSDRTWTKIDADWARAFEPAEDQIDAAIAETERRYRVDERRVALTGLSMGGFGTLMYGARRIDRFCALVAVCGAGRLTDAPALATRPLWLIHGESDPTVPSRLSKDIARAVIVAGGDVRFTGYAGVGHNAWDRAYGDPEVIRFLLAERGAPPR